MTTIHGSRGSGGVPEAQDGDPAGMTILKGSFGGAFEEVSIPDLPCRRE